MSLRVFHMIFIICSIILSIILGVWAFDNFQQTNEHLYLWSSIGSFIIAAGLIVYEIQFIKKVKN